MASLRAVLKQHPVAPDHNLRPFLLLSGETSLREAIWKWNLGRIQFEFDEGTSEEAEDRALALLLGAETGSELAFLTRKITWDRLDDDLDEPDIDEICSRLRDLLDRRNYAVGNLLEGLFGNPSKLDEIRLDELVSRFDVSFNDLTLAGRRAFAQRLFDLRDDILDSMSLRVVRGLDTFVRELRVVIDRTAALGDRRRGELAALSWEVFYTDRIGSQIEASEYSLLLITLPDMLDGSLPLERRQALFDMLRRWERTFAALQEIVNTVGSSRQQGDMRRFMDAQRVFLDNFTPAPPTPDILNPIAAFFGAVTSSINDIRAALQDLGSELSSLDIGTILGTIDDDLARNVAAALFAQGTLALVPFDHKATLINRMTDGSTGDDDELGILHILRESKKRSTAEFLQLIAAGRYALLDSSLDNQEHDQFMALLESV
ncbi:MAG TPA: hypothetical protein VHC97_27605 [Thermoanaerobaculia bacterium]|nr:hypothetical protein [Thermoanaerobaculia bacterium]